MGPLGLPLGNGHYSETWTANSPLLSPLWKELLEIYTGWRQVQIIFFRQYTIQKTHLGKGVSRGCHLFPSSCLWGDLRCIWDCGLGGKFLQRKPESLLSNVNHITFWHLHLPCVPEVTVKNSFKCQHGALQERIRSHNIMWMGNKWYSSIHKKQNWVSHSDCSFLNRIAATSAALHVSIINEFAN